MMISVLPVLKLRSAASAVLQTPHANLVAWVLLASTLTASGDPAAAQAATLQHRRVTLAEPQRSIAPHSSQSYLDRPQSYKPVQFVPFNYGSDFFPSWRQILPKF